MRILLIGATGRTGRHVLAQGIERGHEITPYSRKQTVVDGHKAVTNLAEAVGGQDAVICAIGASDLARRLIPLMRDAGVGRLVMTSSRSVPATRPRLPVALAWMVFRSAYVDLARAEGMLEMSGLDWTVARGTMLTDKPGVGRVHIDFAANATGGKTTLPRADYAMALLDAAENPELIGKAMGVCGN